MENGNLNFQKLEIAKQEKSKRAHSAADFFFARHVAVIPGNMYRSELRAHVLRCGVRNNLSSPFVFNETKGVMMALASRFAVMLVNQMVQTTGEIFRVHLELLRNT